MASRNSKLITNTKEIWCLKFYLDTSDYFKQFEKSLSHYRRIGYNLYVMRQTTCLIADPVQVNMGSRIA